MVATYVTGNSDKAEKFARLIDCSVDHTPLELPEIQSLDLEEVITEKVKYAYQATKVPVIVEDVSVVFHAMHTLPGPFIKWFLESMTLEEICDLLPHENRGATVCVAFAYYDGEQLEIFVNETKGSIALKPSGVMGFGWDKIFIPEGEQVTHGDLDEEKYHYRYKNITKPFGKLRNFLESLPN